MRDWVTSGTKALGEVHRSEHHHQICWEMNYEAHGMPQVGSVQQAENRQGSSSLLNGCIY